MSVFTDPNIDRVVVAELQPYSFNSAARVTKYLASEFVLTGSGDSPAHQHYIGAIAGDIHFRREMFSGTRIGGRTTPDRGTLSVINVLEPDAAASRFDDWLDDTKYSWQAAPCVIYIYDKAQGFSTKTKIFDGVVDEPAYEENTISFPLRNNLYLLDRLFQDNRFDNSYGADLNEKPIPIALGWMYNVRAVLQENRIYQVNDGEIEEITAVRDKGSPLTFDSGVGDVANRAALVSASPASGQYATCLAEGLLKVGTEPDGDLTVDGKGSTLGGTWSALPGDIYEWIIATKLAAGNLASGVKTALNATSYDLAFYTDINEWNALDLLDDLLGGIWVWYGADRAGDFDAGYFDVPAGTSVVDISENETDRDSISVRRIGQVAWRITLRYKRNWTPQNAGSLATGIGEDNLRLYSTEWQEVTVEDSAVKTAYPEAVELTFFSNLYDSADADTEAAKLLTYWKTPRRSISAQTSLKPVVAEINDTLQITNSRFNLSAGKKLRVIVFDEYYLAARTALTLAG